MDRLPREAAKEKHGVVKAKAFDIERLLSHIDPGPAEESEAFVRLIYEQRRTDVGARRDGKIGR